MKRSRLKKIAILCAVMTAVMLMTACATASQPFGGGTTNSNVYEQIEEGEIDMIKFCNQCGHSVTPGSMYCVKCGVVLSASAPHTTYSPPPKASIGTLGRNKSTYGKHDASFETQGIKTVRTACRILNVEVFSTDAEKIRIEWDETASWGLVAEQRGDSLQLDERQYLGLHSVGDFLDLDQPKGLRIELPADFKGSLIIENDTGCISISDTTLDGRIELKTSTGSVWIKGLTTNDYLRINTGAGVMELSGVSAEEYVSLNGGVGPITLDRVRSDKIEVSGTGLIDCGSLFAGYSIVIDGGTGAITCGIDDAAANYTTHCQSGHGRCNLPGTSGNGSKMLRVSTNTGNIDVRFND